MKILILDTYYPGFLDAFRAHQPGLDRHSFADQRKALLAASFGTSDYYSFNLNQLGHQAEDLIINDEILQRQWAKEHHLSVASHRPLESLKNLPLLHRFLGRPSWMQEIALAQIEYYRPDILYLQDLSALSPATLKRAKSMVKLIVGQIACPLPPEANLRAYDLILTSFPHFVPRFRALGIKSEYFRIAFEPRVLERVGECRRIYETSFVGSFSPHHSAGTKLIEAVAERLPLNIWGQDLQYLLPSSPIRRHYRGQAWGLDMYRILASSKIVINRHISVAEENANNMRLYEVTGLGALLMTDAKKNLGELFKVGQEVVAYADATDLTQKLKYYLSHEAERAKIAAAGQKRTLNEHTYAKRMQELVAILKRYL